MDRADARAASHERSNSQISIQTFRKDGTFVREYEVLKDIRLGTVGSVMVWRDAAQTYFVASDDPNGEFHVSPPTLRSDQGYEHEDRKENEAFSAGHLVDEPQHDTEVSGSSTVGTRAPEYVVQMPY